MPIPVACPSCNHRLKAPDSAAGRKAKCPKCGAVVTIPGGVPAKTASGPPAKVKQQAPTVVAKPTLPSRAASVAPQVQQTRPLAVDLRVQHELAPAAPAPAEQTVACAFCGERILAVAKKCKHCGEVLDPALRAAMAPAPQAAPAQQPAAQPTAVHVHNVVNQSTVVNSRRRKSVLVAFLLAFLFGPLGMLYATFLGALVMFLLNAVLIIPTVGLVLLVTWPVGCIWAAAAANRS